MKSVRVGHFLAGSLDKLGLLGSSAANANALGRLGVKHQDSGKGKAAAAKRPPKVMQTYSGLQSSRIMRNVPFAAAHA